MVWESILYLYCRFSVRVNATGCRCSSTWNTSLSESVTGIKSFNNIKNPCMIHCHWLEKNQQPSSIGLMLAQIKLFLIRLQNSLPCNTPRSLDIWELGHWYWLRGVIVVVFHVGFWNSDWYQTEPRKHWARNGKMVSEIHRSSTRAL